MSLRGKRGVTLIELVILIVILAVIGMVGAPVLVSTYDCYVTERDLLVSDARAQVAMDRMAREIRLADPANITTFSAGTLSFTLNGSSVSYSRNGQNQLLRNSDVLATGATGLGFTYLRQDGSQATAASQIWKIQVSLQLAVPQVGTESLATTVFLPTGATTR